jgi:hypothetical protein
MTIFIAFFAVLAFAVVDAMILVWIALRPERLEDHNL